LALDGVIADVAAGGRRAGRSWIPGRRSLRWERRRTVDYHRARQPTRDQPDDPPQRAWLWIFGPFGPIIPGSLIPAIAEPIQIREESSYAESAPAARTAPGTAPSDGPTRDVEFRDGQEDCCSVELPGDLDHRHHLPVRRQERS